MFEDPAQPNAEPVADIDLAIDEVSLFRLERMDDGIIWIRLCRESGEDKVIWLNSSSAISARVEDDKAESALAQSDAEPVAWRYRYKIGGWSGWHVSTLREEIDLELRSCIVPIEATEIEPLYTAHTQSDASAGLIEAAEWQAEAAFNAYTRGMAKWSLASNDLKRHWHDVVTAVLRSRAADRSGK